MAAQLKYHVVPQPRLLQIYLVLPKTLGSLRCSWLHVVLPPNLACLQELEDSSGVGGRKDILPIKSLSSETAPTAEVRVLVCRAMQQALYAAVDYLRDCDDIEMTGDDELG